MCWFLYFVGFLWIAVGASLILYSEEMRSRYVRFMASANELFLGAVAGIFGVLLIIAAFASTHPFIVFILGVLAVAKGAFLFFNPNNLRDKVISWWTEKAPDQVYRLAGIIMLVLGTAIISWVK